MTIIESSESDGVWYHRAGLSYITDNSMAGLKSGLLAAPLAGVGRNWSV